MSYNKDDLGYINQYGGLILPLIALSITGTAFAMPYWSHDIGKPTHDYGVWGLEEKFCWFSSCYSQKSSFCKAFSIDGDYPSLVLNVDSHTLKSRGDLMAFYSNVCSSLGKITFAFGILQLLFGFIGTLTLAKKSYYATMILSILASLTGTCLLMLWIIIVHPIRQMTLGSSFYLSLTSVLFFFVMGVLVYLSYIRSPKLPINVLIIN